MVVCGVCGLRMTVRYHVRQGHPVPDYVCQRRGIQTAQAPCQSIPGMGLDEAVAKVILEAVTPAALEVALEVFKELRERKAELDRQRRRQVERARQPRPVHLPGNQTRCPGGTDAAAVSCTPPGSTLDPSRFDLCLFVHYSVMHGKTTNRSYPQRTGWSTRSRGTQTSEDSLRDCEDGASAVSEPCFQQEPPCRTSFQFDRSLEFESSGPGSETS